jgi:hypothetical protein
MHGMQSRNASMIGRLSLEHWPWLIAGTIHGNKPPRRIAFSKAGDVVCARWARLLMLPSARRQRV